MMKKYLDKVIGDHIADSPRLVCNHDLQWLQKVGLVFLRRKLLCNGDKVGDGQETNGILLILRQLCEEGDNVCDEVLLANLLCESLMIDEGIYGMLTFMLSYCSVHVQRFFCRKRYKR